MIQNMLGFKEPEVLFHTGALGSKLDYWATDIWPGSYKEKEEDKIGNFNCFTKS